MVGALRSVVVVLMTGVAVLWRALEHVVLVAIRAGPTFVRASQGPRRVRKIRSLPRRGPMAHFTIGRERRGQVVRTARAVVVALVAGNAVLRQPSINTVLVALGTIQAAMRAGQREARVIELRAIPATRRVAILAHRREPSRRVWRLARLVVVRQVAAYALAGRTLEHLIDMAARTGGRPMPANQRVARMREVLILPARWPMAVLTVLDPPLLHVVGVRGPRHICTVTVGAVGVGAREVADLRPRMTAEAGDAGMGSNQRKARRRVLGNLRAWSPVGLAVAVLAARSQLSAVHILVTTSAAAVGKHGNRTPVIMTAQTLGFLVCTT